MQVAELFRDFADVPCTSVFLKVGVMGMAVDLDTLTPTITGSRRSSDETVVWSKDTWFAIVSIYHIILLISFFIIIVNHIVSQLGGRHYCDDFVSCTATTLSILGVLQSFEAFISIS